MTRNECTQYFWQKNHDGFSTESFKIYMKAPCGRLLVKTVLNDMNLKEKYKELLIYREPLLASLKNNWTPIETKIYINEEVL